MESQIFHSWAVGSGQNDGEADLFSATERFLPFDYFAACFLVQQVKVHAGDHPLV